MERRSLIESFRLDTVPKALQKMRRVSVEEPKALKKGLTGLRTASKGTETI